jgi:type II secretory pathway pseudopilin PulG
MYNNKGAMFGLDARIALAIFGALSVISGAALYSAIQDSKATSLLTQMQEVGKAWEQYYLDTGQPIKMAVNATCGVPCHYKLAELIESTETQWKGPYISFEKDDEYVITSKGNLYSMVQATKDNSWATSTNWKDNPCQAGTTCSNWIIVGGFSDNSIFKTLDERIDNSDGSDNGKVRWRTAGADWYSHIFYEYSSVPNPQD